MLYEVITLVVPHGAGPRAGHRFDRHLPAGGNPDGGDQLLLEKVPALAGIGERGQGGDDRVFSHKAPVGTLDVITSYSIHYTKLYDFQLRFRTSGRPGMGDHPGDRGCGAGATGRRFASPSGKAPGAAHPLPQRTCGRTGVDR